jgi:uncharacterized protein YjdB
VIGVFQLAKLAQRLARLKWVILWAAALSSCSVVEQLPTDPAFPDSLSTGPAPVSSVTVTPAADSVLVGTTVQLAVTLQDSAGHALTDRPVEWSSANATVATVDAGGLVTARATGTAGISVTSEGKSCTAWITVMAVPVAEVVINPGSATVLKGSVIRLTVALADSAGGALDGRVVAWSTSAPGVARIDADGVVTALELGAASIVAVSEGKADTAAISVEQVPVSSVEVTPSNGSVVAGTALQLSAAARDSAGGTLAGRQIAWTSSAPGVATVSASGLVTGIAPGTAAMVGSVEGKSDTAAITVTRRPVASVTVSPASPSIPAGNAVQLGALLRDSEGDTLTGRTVTWTSSDGGVATVTGTGLATGVAAGTATITATSEGQQGTAIVTVTSSGGESRPGFYVAPSGSSGADGSVTQPWSLSHALSGAGGRIQPGDTVWLRGGTYRGRFGSTVRGAAGRPVVIRQYPGERAIIDVADAAANQSGFYVNGEWTVFWGFEVTNSNTTRTVSFTGNAGRAGAVSNYASHTKYVNLVVHDGGVGFYTEPQYVDVEVTGCIFYNNGWQGPDRGHGHAIYLKSNTGPVVARDNVLFNQFGYGIHVYSDAGSGQLNNIRLEGNVAFNNGTLAANSTSQNILVGGESAATGTVLRDNLTYFSPGTGGTNVRVGYSTTRNGTVELQGNYFVGGAPVVDFGYWSAATVGSTTLVGSGTVVTLNDRTTSGKVWSANVHQRDPQSSAWRYDGRAYTFAGWRSATGLAPTDAALPGSPAAANVVVRSNPYEPGRAVVTVYNWPGLSAVLANPGGMLNVGDSYEVRNVQALFGAPAASGTFSGGTISIPLGGVTPPTPIGMSSSRAPRTGPAFDVFILTKR